MGITSGELPGMTFDFTFPLEKCFSHLAGVDFAAVVEKCQPILPQQLQSLPQGGDIPHRVHRLLVLEEGADPLARGGDSTPEEEVCGVLDAVIGVFGIEPVHITRSPDTLPPSCRLGVEEGFIREEEATPPLFCPLAVTSCPSQPLLNHSCCHKRLLGRHTARDVRLLRDYPPDCPWCNLGEGLGELQLQLVTSQTRICINGIVDGSDLL